MGSATMIMPDTTKLRVNGTRWHSILPVGPCLGRTGPVVFTHEGRSWRHVGRGVRSEPIDQAQNVGEQVTRDGDLSHLEDDIATVADDLRADLDELFAQRGQ